VEQNISHINITDGMVAYGGKSWQKNLHTNKYKLKEQK